VRSRRSLPPGANTLVGLSPTLTYVAQALITSKVLTMGEPPHIPYPSTHNRIDGATADLISPSTFAAHSASPAVVVGALHTAIA
jgi:hypothetical protein